MLSREKDHIEDTLRIMAKCITHLMNSARRIRDFNYRFSSWIIRSTLHHLASIFGEERVHTRWIIYCRCSLGLKTRRMIWVLGGWSQHLNAYTMCNILCNTVGNRWECDRRYVCTHLVGQWSSTGRYVQTEHKKYDCKSSNDDLLDLDLQICNAHRLKRDKFKANATH